MALGRRTGVGAEIGIGVHCGPTLVTTQNRQLDYFGATVRAVLDLPTHAGRNILLTEPVDRDPPVREIIGDTATTTVESVTLTGAAVLRVRRIHSTR